MIEYHDIVAACERDLVAFGDTYQGAGWTKSEEQAERRYDVMLDLVGRQPRRCRVLDFGCGSARLFDRALATGAADGVDYHGLDLSEAALAHARAKHPAQTFHQLDVLADDSALPMFDVVLMNGVLHYKGDNSFAEMTIYAGELLDVLWRHAERALAFNVMSTHVEWERDDLFHLPMRQAADIVAARLSRHFTIREDYGLYEYTMYVHR